MGLAKSRKKIIIKAGRKVQVVRLEFLRHPKCRLPPWWNFDGTVIEKPQACPPRW